MQKVTLLSILCCIALGAFTTGCVGEILEDNSSNSDSVIDQTCSPSRNNSCNYRFSQDYSESHSLSYIESKEGLAELLVEVTGSVNTIGIMVDGRTPAIQYSPKHAGIESIPFYLSKPLTSESSIQVFVLDKWGYRTSEGKVKIVTLIVPCSKPC
jgi:hypothetical protein